jgi:hypothetical protein
MQSIDRTPSNFRDWVFPLAVSAIICAVALYSWASTDRDAYERCRLITSAQARLACYDDAAATRPPAKGSFAPAFHQQQPGTGS